MPSLLNKLLVTGFSAGGVASSAVYYQARRTLVPAKGFLLNDSGPVFPAPNSTYNSKPLHTLITTQWNLASLYGQLAASFNPNDFGSINAMVATQDFSSMASASVMSPVGMSMARSKTLKPRP